MYSELATRGFSDIRPAYSSVFRHILPAGSRATDLAERAQLTKQSMAYLLDHLEKNGYVEFVPDPTDGRAKLARLTERGVAVQQTLIEISRSIEDDAILALGTEDMAEWRRIHERLSTYLESRIKSEA